MAALSGQRTFRRSRGRFGYPEGWLYVLNVQLSDLGAGEQIINRHSVYKSAPLGLDAGLYRSPRQPGPLPIPSRYRDGRNHAPHCQSVYAHPLPVAEQFLQQYPGGWTTTATAFRLSMFPSAEASNNALQIDLWPTPDATYTVTVDYRKRPTPLSGDGGYSVIPPEHEDYLVYALPPRF